jgi:branched-chain amino acid transport system substrate-binding protein
MSFGAETFLNMYLATWPQVETNKTLGVMWPDNADGNAIRELFPAPLKKAGYTLVDPGAYADGSTDFSTQIARFKAEGCEIFNAFPTPADYGPFWRQASQKGFRPRIVHPAKVGLFSSDIEALGAPGVNMAGGCYWAPTWPYTSTSTGLTGHQISVGYSAETGRHWNTQLGATLSLFDAITVALVASGDPKDRAAVAKAIGTLDTETIVGGIAFGKGPVPNVVVTPIVAGQWVASRGRFAIEFVIVENTADRNVPVAAQLRPYR